MWVCQLGLRGWNLSSSSYRVSGFLYQQVNLDGINQDQLIFYVIVVFHGHIFCAYWFVYACTYVFVM